MNASPQRPHVCALVADARGARIYSRRKSKISLLAALVPRRRPFGAKDIATWLEEHLDKLRVDRLILIAPAALLASLHQVLTPHIYNHVIAEMRRSFRDDETGLQAELKKILWF